MRLGIDLGTVSSAVYCYDERLRRPIPLVRKGLDFPSWVTRVDDRILVGQEAKDRVQLGIPKEDYTNELKRRLDRDEVLRFPTSDIVGHMLGALLKIASDKLEARGMNLQDVSGVVISVPNDFGLRQRTQIREGAKRNGVLELREEEIELLPEPVAALIGYQYRLPDPEKLQGRILVCDFGGGTTDVSIGRWEATEFSLEFTDGHDRRGGLNIDEVVVRELIVPKYVRTTGRTFPFAAPSSIDESLLRYRIFERAREMKEGFSKSEDYVFAGFPGCTELHGETFHRRDFEAKVDSFLENVASTCKNALNELKRPIRHMLLVGGSTLIPRFRAKLESLCKRERIECVLPSEPPLNLVAEGVGLYAGRAELYKINDIFNHDLALARRVGGYQVVVRKGEPLPVQPDHRVELNILKVHDVGGNEMENALHLSLLEEKSTEAGYVTLKNFKLDLNSLGLYRPSFTQEIKAVLRFNYKLDRIEIEKAEILPDTFAQQYIDPELVRDHPIVGSVAGKLEIEEFVRKIDQAYSEKH